MSRRQLFTVTFLLVFILLLWQLGLILSPFFSPILWAVILATTTYPVYIWLLACVGQRGEVSVRLESPEGVERARAAGRQSDSRLEAAAVSASSLQGVDFARTLLLATDFLIMLFPCSSCSATELIHGTQS